MKKIGKFSVCGLLGQGGMGRVYKVAYPVTGKIGAMKLLEPNPFLVTLLGNDTIEAMFTQEAVTMAGIRHPHVAEILDFDQVDGHLYYIMEYYCNNLGTMIGESYETEKKSRIITLDKAIEYTRQILSGLSRLHFSSLIHRDIKPFNILITDEDQVKICDFGLSKLRNESFKSHASLKVGSPFYAPPEQEKDPDSVDFSSDLYAVGIMLFRMATGRLPQPPDILPSRFNSDLDPYWDRFILKACDPDPRNRYRDADAMINDLEELGQRWKQKKQTICNAPDWMFDDEPIEPETIHLRSTPLKVSKQDARPTFDTDGLMRPRIYTKNRFETQADRTILDRTTHLIWQMSGTRFPVNMVQARDYIDRLNQDAHAGITSWRLPTTNELLSLINRPPTGKDYCLPTVFDPTQKWLWSCDRCTFISAWYVNLELGFAGYNDLTSYYHVKAVANADSRNA